MVPDTRKAWVAEDENDDGEVAAEYAYNNGDDEDEFGLPSIVAKKKDSKSKKGSKIEAKSGTNQTSIDHRSLLDANLSLRRARANSSDIAEERGGPSYPNPQKQKGKILRPQYKDILKGQRR